MISIQNRITALVKLGDFLGQFSIEKIEKRDNIEHNELFFEGFLHQIKIAQESNSWFTKNNILFALNSISKSLTYNSLDSFVKSVNLNIISSKKGQPQG